MKRKVYAVRKACIYIYIYIYIYIRCNSACVIVLEAHDREEGQDWNEDDDVVELMTFV